MINFGILNLFKSTTQLAVRTCTNFISTAAIRPLSSPFLSNLKQLPYSKTNNGLLNSNLLKHQEQSLPQMIQVRNSWGYKGRMMLKDIKRRELLRKFAPARVRLQTLRGNTILPKAFKVKFIKKLF